MKILKLVLITASALKFINYTEDADKVIYAVNVSREDWEDNLIQVKWNKKRWHIIYYENRIWSDVEKHYNVRK